MFRLFLFALAFGSCATALLADSFYENELKQLTEAHDKAITNAIQPINKNYRVALEQLLQRSMRNKDLDASAKVVAALKAMDAAAEAQSTPSPSPLRDRIENLLTSKTWVHRGQFHYNFTKDGHVLLVEFDRKGKYKIDPQTGFVTFTWEHDQPPGEGMQFDEKAGTFMHNKGDPLVPTEKK